MNSIRDERISLSVGDGQNATQQFIKREILSRFGNDYLNQLADATRLVLPSVNVAVTTDSYIVDPPVFPGGTIGRLAVSGTVNDLVASGAKPLYITLGLIISEDISYSFLDSILNDVAEEVSRTGALLVAGDTKVINRQAFDGIVINTTGLGIPVQPSINYGLLSIKDGDRIITTGTIGDHELAILSYREGLGFEQRIQSDCASLDRLLLPLLERYDIHFMRDPTRGGVLGILADIVETCNKDVIIESHSLPIRPEVSMACEMLGLDPLTMVNEGKMILVVNATDSDDIITELVQHPLGSNSAIIGTVCAASSSVGKILVREGSSLKVRIRPEGNNIPRLC